MCKPSSSRTTRRGPPLHCDPPVFRLKKLMRAQLIVKMIDAQPTGGLVLSLTTNELKQIHDAVSSFRGISFEVPTQRWPANIDSGRSLPRHLINKATFPLTPEFSSNLRRMTHTHLNERAGFLILRGVDPEQYTDEENIILFAGISSHIASQRVSHIRTQAPSRLTL